GLPELDLRVLVGRIEKHRLLELDGCELGTTRRSIELPLLEVELRRLELRAGERQPVTPVLRIQPDGLGVVDHGEIPVLERLLVAGLAKGTRARARRQCDQQEGQRGSRVKSFSHSKKDLSSFMG